MATEPYGGTRREMNRAIWRLNLLEWVMLFTAAGVAVLAGWLVAWLFRDIGMPFRLIWILASVLLFAIPGASVLLREGPGERADPGPPGGDVERKGK